MFEKCEFNPYTLTGRPSNHFNGINYSALNKTDGSRKRFISRNENGFLMEIDLTGFHLFLIYTILGQKFPENIYQELSKFYPEGEDPKGYTFRQIYGGIDKELLNIEPFRSINQLSKETFVKYKTGSLKTFLFDKPMVIEEGLNQWKVFNYMLQNLETEFNATLLERLNNLLREKETKLILYIYDAFLFDYSPKDGKSILKEIIGVFEEIPIHIKAGKNYHNMKIINLK